MKVGLIDVDGHSGFPNLARWCNNKTVFKTVSFEEYDHTWK